MRLFPAYVLSLAIALGGCGGHAFYPSRAIEGRVVDVETGQALAGAAVVAKWDWGGPGLGHPTEGIHDAVEVVTDADGNFTLPRKMHVRLYGEVEPPFIIVYYPGYKDFHGQEGSGLFAAKNSEPAQIALRKLGPGERMKGADTPTLVDGIPKSKIPNLLRLVNVQRKALGLEPIRR